MVEGVGYHEITNMTVTNDTPYMDDLEQERRAPSALAMELPLSCINPLKSSLAWIW